MQPTKFSYNQYWFYVFPFNVNILIIFLMPVVIIHGLIFDA